VKELAERGVKADISAEYWISTDNRFVQDHLKVNLNLPGDVIPDSGLPNLSLRLDAASQYWNHNEPVQYPALTHDRVVTVEQLAFHPEKFDAFGAASPVRALAELAFAPFDDVPDSHWAYWPVTALRTVGVVSGYDGNRFLPSRPITRAEFVAMAVNALGLEPAEENLSAFKDAQQIPAWAREALQAAVHAGLIRGYHDGTLRPNQPITRAELVAILVRALELPPAENHPLPYADRDHIPRWAVPAVKAATAHGLVSGRDGNRFAPNDKATRAEAATILYRILQSLHNGQ
jgi:S-layer homology domain.